MAKRRMTEKRRIRALQEKISCGEVTLESLGLEKAKAPGRRPPGRPKGYKVSDETKKRISDARKLQNRGEQFLPPHNDVDETVARIVCERDQWNCRACHIPFMQKVRGKTAKQVNSKANFRVYRFRKADHDLENPLYYALLCADCARSLTVHDDNADSMLELR